MDWNNKTCLVTGGAGFLGSHLVDKLLGLGARVILLDIVDSGRSEGGNLSIIKGDVAQKGLVRNKEIDFIFHLAALAHPKACNENPELAFSSNVTGTMNMLLLARDAGVRKFLFPSTAQLYGRYPKYIPVDEKHEIEYSDNFYNTSKRLGEDLCMVFKEAYGVPIVFFRLFNAFGPRQSNEYLIPTIISQALEKKEIELWNEKPTRDFTFMSDTVMAFIKAAESDFVGGPINIGSGKETRVGDIAKQIAESLGAEIKFLDKEVIGSMRLCCNNSYAKKILGWEPTVSFKDGLDKAIEWCRTHGVVKEIKGGSE